MKSQTARMLALCSLFLFAGHAWGQLGSPVVYVSGTGGVISSVNTSTGATTTLVSNANAAYEGLVVGPDNAASDNTSTTNHPYLLYACDPTHNTIIRFDPNNVAAGIETVYSGGTLQQPQCGRFTNSGDLIVSSKVAGSGIWKIAGAANIALGAGGFPAPVQNPPNGKFSATQVSQGIAQKNIGDLLIVDSANRQVIRSQYSTIPAFSGLPTVFIPASSLLLGPLGIARKSAGDIYISNQSKNTNSIVHYNAQGASGSTCVSFGKKTAPLFMQMSADDTLYVATSATTSGALYSVNTATCVATQVPSSTLPPLIGVALPPTTVTQTATFSGTQTFNFGFAAYQFTSPSCTLTVEAMPENVAQIQTLINTVTTDNGLPFLGGTPAVNLGWDGFEIAFDVPVNPANCLPEFTDGTYDQLLGAQLDNLLVSNPRIIACDAKCGVMTSFGDYPLGGLLPADSTYSGHGTGSEHFLTNENTSNSSEPGTFCGLESPFTVPNVPPPGISGTFSSGQAVSVKFRLAAGAYPTGNCQNGPFITDATALLSIAQIFDSNGNAVFNPVAIGSSGSSTPTPPTFKIDNNKQYQFSLSLQGYASGTYSLTVTFLSSNTSYQVIEFQVQ